MDGWQKRASFIRGTARSVHRPHVKDNLILKPVAGLWGVDLPSFGTAAGQTNPLPVLLIREAPGSASAVALGFGSSSKLNGLTS